MIPVTWKNDRTVLGSVLCVVLHQELQYFQKAAVENSSAQICRSGPRSRPDDTSTVANDGSRERTKCEVWCPRGVHRWYYSSTGYYVTNTLISLGACSRVCRPLACCNGARTQLMCLQVAVMSEIRLRISPITRFYKYVTVSFVLEYQDVCCQVSPSTRLR